MAYGQNASSCDPLTHSMVLTATSLPLNHMDMKSIDAVCIIAKCTSLIPLLKKFSPTQPVIKDPLPLCAATCRMQWIKYPL